MENRKRRKLIIAAIAKAVEELGFHHHSGEYFIRSRGPLLDSFFFQQSRSQYQLSFTYGIDAPGLLTCLNQNKTLAPDSDKPRLWITPHLGRLGPYGCKHEEHVEKSAGKVRDDLQTIAVPWLDQIASAEDLAEYYRINEVRRAQPTAPPPLHSGLKTGVYGMMLVDTGRNEEAAAWLHNAKAAWQAVPQSVEKAAWLSLIEARIQSIS